MDFIDKLIYWYLASKHKERVAIFVNDCIGLHIIAHKIYEEKELNLIVENLSSAVFKNHCVDVGANIGNHSRFFSKKFERVLSFEPQKDLFQLLSLNTKNLKNIEIHNYGLDEKDSEKLIYFDEYNRMGASYLKTNKSNEITTLKSYDNYFKNKKISFVKIDVEGYELNVLKGMIQSIKKHNPIIAFEGKRDSTDKIINFLKQIGYDLFLVPNEYKINHIIRSRNYLLVVIRYLIRSISFLHRPKLIPIQNSKRYKRGDDFNLILSVNKNSKNLIINYES